MLSSSALESLGVSWQFGAILGSGVVAFILFRWWISQNKNPFVYPNLLEDRHYLSAAAIAFLSSATRFGTVVLVPILLIDVTGLEPIWVGVVLFPGALLIGVFSPASGRWADRVGGRG